MWACCCCHGDMVTLPQTWGWWWDWGCHPWQYAEQKIMARWRIRWYLGKKQWRNALNNYWQTSLGKTLWTWQRKTTNWQTDNGADKHKQSIIERQRCRKQMKRQTWVALKLLTWLLTWSLWTAKIFVWTGRCILAETGDSFWINELMSETKFVLGFCTIHLKLLVLYFNLLQIKFVSKSTV